MKKTVIGIDLATEKGKTGLCILGRRAKTFVVRSDKEIMAIIGKLAPTIVAIDAPLTFPRKGHYRRCDKMVRNAGIPIFSFNLQPLAELAKRGIRLAKKLRTNGFLVIETYQYAVIRMNKEINKKVSTKDFATKDERDAYICALVARRYQQGKAKCFFGGGKIWY